MSKPEELTLTQLKEELLAIGIKVPSKRTKAHYVDLYYTHIVDKQDGGYSDDNVQVNTSSSKRSARILNRKHQTFPSIPERSDVETSHVSVGTEDKRTEVQAILKSVQTDITGNVDASVSTLLNEKSEKSEVDKKTSVGAEEAQKTKTTSLASEVDDLSNTEIRSRLKDLGQSVGPIGPATRKVYLKKLVKLLEGGDAVVETAAVETQGKTFSDEDEPVPMVAVTRSSSRRRTMQTLLDEPPIVALRRTSSSTTKRSMVSRFNSDISSSQPALSMSTPNLSHVSVDYLENVPPRSPTEATPITVAASKSKSRLSSLGASRDELYGCMTSSQMNLSLPLQKAVGTRCLSNDSQDLKLQRFSDTSDDDLTLVVAASSGKLAAEKTTASSVEKCEKRTSTPETPGFAHNHVKEEPYWSPCDTVPLSSKDSCQTQLQPHEKKGSGLQNQALCEDSEKAQSSISSRFSAFIDSFQHQKPLSKHHRGHTSSARRRYNHCSSATKRRPLRSSAITNQQSTTSIVTQKTVETRETVVEQKSDTSSNQKEETDSSENVTIKPERRWIPIWVQIIFTLLVVLFAYLVIRTLEKAPPHLTLPSDAADN